MADRRAIVTGLAAVHSPGIVPALPIYVAPLERRGVVLGSRWHFHEPTFHEINLRHIESGLLFARHPAVADPRAYALLNSDTAAAIFDARTIGVITSAAAFVALQIEMILTCRPEHKGAVVFRYRPDADPDNPYYAPITEDAPPLPRIAT